MQTACGLDCYDACKIIVEEGDLKINGDASHPAGNGALCALLNKYMLETPRIEKPRVNGVEVSMEVALAALAEAFKADKSLLWRGSGNFGVMQEVSNLFMEKIEGSLTKGSLCDASGDAGIVEGRGVNRTLPLEHYAIAVSGIAGPDGGTVQKPVGTTWIAVAGPSSTMAEKFLFGKNRKRNIRLAAVTALNKLRMMIAKNN